MRINYCPKCNKAGLKWDNAQGKGYDGLTEHERYAEYQQGKPTKPETLEGYHYRFCPRCQEWVKPNKSANYDQHKR